MEWSSAESILTARVALVTGAGRGLGRAHALALAADGLRVVVNDLGTDVDGRGIDGTPASAVVAEIEAEGGVAVGDTTDVASIAGGAAAVGVALDAFGRIDVVVSALGEPAELWQNISPEPNHWLILNLIGTRSNRDGIGAVIRLGNQWNHVTTAVGYASSSPRTVHFGTGKLEKIERLEIRWPSGIVQILRNVATNQVLEIHEPSK